jgi:DNA polymerase-3 subunit gamma/tau
MMSHVVLARKYRPKDFSSVVGQDSIVSILLSAIKQNRMAHALLFTGGRGVGKTTLARLVAKSLVCIGDNKPCNNCFQCKGVDDFNSLDVIEIDGASNTSVDDVRELRENAKYQPTSAKYKIFIIDEVHMLSQNAFNALLKILEEPPSHIIFIFATTEVHKLPKTILSRCQRYDFKRFSENTVYLNLKDIIKKENYSFEEEAVKLLAKLSDGSMRDALSMLEQVLHLGLEHYTNQDVSLVLGVIDHQSVKELSSAMLSKNTTLGLKIIHEIHEKGLDICQLIQDITERFRNLSLMAHVGI